MKIDSNGVKFTKCISAAPSTHTSSFTDGDGARLRIDTATLVMMYELVKFDLERRGSWECVMQRVRDAAKP